MSQNELRLSQLVRAFGPGSMVDLPTRSVVIGGLEQWEMRGGAFTTLSEPRLQTRLEAALKAMGRLDGAAHLTLRTPPVKLDGVTVDARGVGAPIFPTWFVCELSETPDGADSGAARRRRLVPWKELDTVRRRRFEFEDRRKSDVTPIRFVCACPKGHLQDIDWRWAVHGQEKCGEPMFVQEKGTSGDPAETAIVCRCGKRLSLSEASRPGQLGRCIGRRPWLLDTDPEGCGDHLKLLIRTATNTYFPRVYTVISLPTEEDDIARLVGELFSELAPVETLADVATAKRFNHKVAAALGPVPDAEILGALERLRESAVADAKGSAKPAEFDLLASGRSRIGQDHPSAKLYARTLERETWFRDDAGVDLSGISSLVAVHRLREVSALYGFTRFEPAPTADDEGMEDVRLAVHGAAISRGADWLPAVEQFGEGLFIAFDPAAIRAWLERETVRARLATLIAGHEHWSTRFTENPPAFPGGAYVMLHSLSHALMAEIALDCGYPSSSLKERIYAFPGQGDGGRDRFGVLIYTAAAGAQGTLGGLVGTAPRFAATVRGALERLEVCSNDPICADHEPDDRSGDRATHGAACHGCLLIAETSCERRNQSLDRALLAETMARPGAAFFARAPA
jgi:hypothetical protein